MATKTRDIAPIVKGKRSPSPSKTRSLAHTNAINLIASNRKNTYLKSKVSSSHDKTQGKKPTPSTYPNIHHKQTLDYRSSIDKPPSNFDNTQVIKKNPTLLNELNIVHNKPNVARGSLFDSRPSLPSSLDNVQAKKIASSSSSIHNKQNPSQRRLSFDNKPPQSPSHDHNTHVKKIASDDTNTHNKQNLARRRLSFDHRPPLSSLHDHSPQSTKLVPKSDHSIHRKQTPTRRRLSIDHKPPLSSPLLKSRTSSNPRERVLKPSMPTLSKNFTSHKPLSNKLPKTPHTSTKDVNGKQHSVGLYAKALNMNNTITKNQDSPFGLTLDIIANIVPHEVKELEKEEEQELVIEDNGELSENVNIDEYLKAAESSSLYVVENQEVIKNMEVPKEEELLDIIENHKEVEDIKNLEPSDHDVEEIEKQENEYQEEKEKDQENETPLDDCEQKKDEGNLKIDQEESEGRNNKEKEENNNKVSTTTMTFAKAYTHLVHKKEIVVSSNDVIEETASKLREQRKNRVKALASAFETVISLQDSK